MVALNGVRTVVLGLTFAMLVSGCKKTPATDDTSLNAQVQQSLSADPNLSGQPIAAEVANGVVTLNGTVSSDAIRTAASGDAAQVAGVKTVVDNLVVRTPQPGVTTALAQPAPAQLPPPIPQDKTRKPSAATPQSTPPQPAPVVRNIPAPPPPAPVAQVQAPPPPPPAPARHDITLPAGTSIPVRITQTLDSKTTQSGDKFTGAVASDIIVNDIVVLPQGTPVTGHVDAAQDAAHFKGNSLLTISLSSISHRGERIDCATEPFTKQGEGRGKNTAEKVGGGAAVGAILGGILGGGKGAAIGAAAGGGVGAGANAATRGQQVQIESETVVRFKLSDAVIVHITTGGGSPDAPGPGLERHDNQ